MLSTKFRIIFLFSEEHFHLLAKEQRISENVFQKVNLEKKVNQNR